MNSIRLLAGLVMAAVTVLIPALSSAAEVPILVVRGAESASPIVYDRDDLEEMGLVSIKTSTPWNEGVVDFEGVPLEHLLEQAGVSGTTATITALNDYSVDIPVSDFAQFDVILATRRDGAHMPVADQGPFFVIYPFDSDPALQGQPYHGRAVWQVKEISVE